LSVLSIKDDDILFSLIDSICLITVLGIVAVFPDYMSLYPAFAEEETKLDDPVTNYICILCTYQHDTMTGKEGANQSISYHSSQKGDTDNNKTDRPTTHFRVQHTLSSPLGLSSQGLEHIEHTG
jgi:hypothetical protein